MSVSAIHVSTGPPVKTWITTTAVTARQAGQGRIVIRLSTIVQASHATI